MGYSIIITIIVVYLFIKYIEPKLNVLYDVFIQEQNLKITEINFESTKIKNETQSSICEMVRKYPELKESGSSNLIGYNREYEEEYYDDDEEDYEEEDSVKIDNKKIGFNK